MTNYAAAMLVLASAVNARVEGMKIDNAERMSRDLPPQYCYDAFAAAEQELANIHHHILNAPAQD